MQLIQNLFRSIRINATGSHHPIEQRLATIDPTKSIGREDDRPSIKFKEIDFVRSPLFSQVIFY